MILQEKAEAITKMLNEAKERIKGVVSDIQEQAVESLERAADEVQTKDSHHEIRPVAR